MTALIQAPLNVNGVPNGLREAVVDFFKKNGGVCGLAAHRPLGGIVRVRKAVYEMGKKFRAEKNGRVIEEPREMVSFGD